MSPLVALRTYLASLPTPTALSATLSTLIRLLLQYTALATDSSHLLLGTSLTSLAIQLVSSVSQGGGFHIREEAQEEWHPGEAGGGTTPLPESVPKRRTIKQSVRIIRPLREVGMKECAAWSWWMDLPVVGREKWEWQGNKPGLHQLTKGKFASSVRDRS